jgi:hypothetical protein
MKTVSLIPLAAFVLAGCRSGPVYVFTATATPQAPKPADCDFRVVVTEPPAGQFEELGALDARRTPSNRLDRFREHARATVCQAGGDLVLAQANGYGYYIRGIVYRAAKSEAASTVSGSP